MNTDPTLDFDPAIDPELERAIRELDPADAELSAAQLDRKAALLDAILADTSHPQHTAHTAHAGASVAPLLATGGPVGPGGPAASTRPGGRDDAARPGSRTRRRVRWLLPAAAAAVLTGALVISNSLGGDQSAYATWTQDPQPLTGKTLERAEAACLDQAKQFAAPVRGVPQDIQPTVDLDSIRTVTAEQRGQYLFVTMATDNGSTVQCFFDAANPDRATAAGGGVSTASSPELTPLAADAVDILGPGMMGGPEGGFAFLTGRVGADVTGITLHSEGQTVEATVDNGYTAAWWPYEISTDAIERGGGLDPIITVDVHLADGSVLTNVPTGMSVTLPGPSEIGPVVFGGGVGPEGYTESATGYVGDDVVGVTVVAPNGTRTEAEVADGEFRAEWPAEQSSNGMQEFVEPTYDVTLRDGTVLTGQVAASRHGQEVRGG